MKLKMACSILCFSLAILVACVPLSSPTVEGSASPILATDTPYATFTPVSASTATFTPPPLDPDLRITRIKVPFGFFYTVDMHGNTQDIPFPGNALVFDEVTGYWQYLMWSPDYKVLAVRASNPCESADQTANCTTEAADGIHFLDWNSKTVNLIVQPTVIANPFWSPDGKFLAFVSVKEAIETESGFYSVLSTYEQSTGEIKEILQVPGIISYISWSPDQEWIAFLQRKKEANVATQAADPCVMDKSDCKTEELYVVHPDGSQLTKLLDNAWHIISKVDYNLPTWSHDSRWLTVTTIENLEKQIVMLNPKSGEQIRPVLPPNLRVFSYPIWSPKDDFFLFEGIEGESHSIYRLDGESGQITKLTVGNNDSQPAFSPNGEWVAFVSDQGSTASLHIMRSDGTNVLRIADGYWVGINSHAWFKVEN